LCESDACIATDVGLGNWFFYHWFIYASGKTRICKWKNTT
jgi:hypothetical protein